MVTQLRKAPACWGGFTCRQLQLMPLRQVLPLSALWPPDRHCSADRPRLAIQPRGAAQCSARMRWLAATASMLQRQTCRLHERQWRPLSKVMA
jgi:hypothetical protein